MPLQPGAAALLARLPWQAQVPRARAQLAAVALARGRAPRAYLQRVAAATAVAQAHPRVKMLGQMTSMQLSAAMARSLRTKAAVSKTTRSAFHSETVATALARKRPRIHRA
jgi:hypothetical protein